MRKPYFFGLCPLEHSGPDRERWDSIVRAMSASKRDGIDYYIYNAKHGWTVSVNEPAGYEFFYQATPEDNVYIVEKE